MFIGSREIKTVTPIEGTQLVNVEFINGHAEEMAKATLDMITTQEAGEGLTNDAIRFYFASKYIKDMAEHYLTYGELTSIAQGIQNLATNMRDQAASMAFGADHLQNIKVAEVFKIFSSKDEEVEDQSVDSE